MVKIDECQIEDKIADGIIYDIRGMLRSFKIKVYDEDSGYGLLRHVLVRRGFRTGEVMVVLVLASPILPSKNNFVKALREKHPEVTTVVVNVNDRRTSVVLGERNITIYGKGFIEDELCGLRFRISPSSFYQINPVQTEILYGKAIEFAGLTGKEKVIDAYCGIGTIGMAAAGKAGSVIGVEVNRDAVRDAVTNAKRNNMKISHFAMRMPENSWSKWQHRARLPMWYSWIRLVPEVMRHSYPHCCSFPQSVWSIFPVIQSLRRGT